VGTDLEHAGGLVASLATAADHYDHGDASRHCRRLVELLRADEDRVPTADVLLILRHLRKKRWFDLSAAVAEAALQRAEEDEPAVLSIRLHYAQALIEQGLHLAAVEVLERLLERCRSPDDAAECRGLLGRAYKQMFVVSAPSRRHRPLRRAIALYDHVYRTDPDRFLWHGINSAALVQRAAAEGIAVDDLPPAVPTAEAILAVIERRSADPDRDPDVWDLATPMEACLVLGRDDEAATWMEAYMAHPRADTFELTATLRQLEEIWRLDAGRSPGATLLPRLQARILAGREGGRIELRVDEVAETGMGLEKVLGQDGMVTYAWYRTGLLRGRAVAAIADEFGEPVGTGFLVLATDLHPALASHGTVLLTNSHVVGVDVPGALALEDARVTFEVRSAETTDATTHRVAEVLWTSPPHLLDTSILRLDPTPDADGDACPLTAACPRTDGTQRVYVIGYPQGRSLSFAIADNLLLDRDDRALHYRAPTEPGSSGSPVFNRRWQVIALHHAGRSDMPRLHGQPGTYPANEGIWIEAVRRALGAARTRPPDVIGDGPP
jgi:hypothetical protein